MKKLSLGKVACIVVVFCAVSGVAAFAQTFTSIASFDFTNGAYPQSSLAQGANGDFYGTASEGTDTQGGTIFEITPTGAMNTVFAFCPARGDCRDGQDPYASLAETANGNFYGTTLYGGANRYGTVFEFGADGKLITLYSFCPETNSQGFCVGGASPYGSLVQGYDGDYYGTTLLGGAGVADNSNCGNACGTIFKITPTGTFTALYSFCSLTNCADGREALAGLVRATDGKFYGTTIGGGANNGGTIFSIAPAGRLTTLYSFCSKPSCADGSAPYAPLVQAADGNFYGTTEIGGASDDGTVFEMTPAGKLTTLYSFCSQTGCADGRSPEAGLIQATDGNFYGTTTGGGAYGEGTIFEVSPLGILTTLYSFCSQPECADGAGSTGALVQGTDGNFYGTTRDGGGFGEGTVFSLSTGLASFVKTLPTARAAGGNVTILGNNLTGATSVTFNGAAATLITVSDTAITTTVPTGATTGPVAVVTPSGTLTSNVPFQVIP
jgi:uncharacterized repeat protein (TIGR03803 family)